MTQLPFPLKGKIYRRPMPFGTYDENGVVLNEYFANQISVIVSLAIPVECEEKAHRNLYGGVQGRP